MNDKSRYLYRGVGIEFFDKTGGKLIPKVTTSFIYAFKYGDPSNKYGSGTTYGTSATNAVIRHQLNQDGFPTSGVSTTPHIHRAQYYATHGGKYKFGYLFKINRDLLEVNNVSEFAVADYVRQPSVPEDEEVILVHRDFGNLPDEIIAEIIRFASPEPEKFQK